MSAGLSTDPGSHRDMPHFNLHG